MNPVEFLRLYEAKLNLAHFDAVAPLIAEDAVFWFSDGTHAGLAEIRAAFEQTWQRVNEEKYWLEDVNWIATSDTVATCIYTFHWKGLWDGKAFESKGRGTTVLRNSGGQWKIIHEHLSHFPK
ncbi:YybH family protein [Rhizobium binxianense]